MRRTFLVALVLVGTSSCQGVNQNPPYGQTGPAITTRPTPPSPSTWNGGQSSSSLARSTPTDPATNSQLASYALGKKDSPYGPMDTSALYPPRDADPAQRGNSSVASSTAFPAVDSDQAMAAFAMEGRSGAGMLPVPNTTSQPGPGASTSGTGSLAKTAGEAIGNGAPPPLPPPSPVAMAQAATENANGLQPASYTDRQSQLDPGVANKSLAPVPVITNGQEKATANAAATVPLPVGTTSAVNVPVATVGNQTAPQTVNLLDQPAADSEPSTSPITPIVRVVNSKRITLHYELKDAGAGVTAVDLFATRDMHTWKKMETAQPTNNSYVIDVRDEGLYGFTMVARAGTAPAAMPKPNELAQVLVTVDTVKPVVQLLGVELSLTAKTPALVVRWTAQDKNFNKHPITISYAETPEGPWVPLAKGIENTGRQEIALIPTMPREMLLRVEAVDIADNVGSAQTARPICLNLPTATAFAVVEPTLPKLLPTPAPVAPSPSAQLVGVE